MVAHEITMYVDYPHPRYAKEGCGVVITSKPGTVLTAQQFEHRLLIVDVVDRLAALSDRYVVSTVILFGLSDVCDIILQLWPRGGHSPRFFRTK